MNAGLTLSPSKIAVLAAGLTPPAGTPAAEAGRCAMCGIRHEAGDPVTAFKPAPSFTNRVNLADKDSQTICVWCEVVLFDEPRWFTSPFKLGKAMFCREGAFRAATNKELAYWLLNPPEGPFVFVQADQQRQHIVWRAPVNATQELYHIRAGETLLAIRTGALREGLDAARRAVAAVNEAGGRPLKSPFLSLSRERDSLQQGTPHQRLVALAQTSEPAREDLARLLALTPGELWALTALLYSEPEKSAPVATPLAPPDF